MPYARTDYSAEQARSLIAGATSTGGPKPHASIHARTGELAKNSQFNRAAAVLRVTDADEPDKTSMIVGDGATQALRAILNHADFQKILEKLDKGHLLAANDDGTLNQNQERDRVARFHGLKQAWENPETDLDNVRRLGGAHRPSTSGITTGMRNEFTNHGSVSVSTTVNLASAAAPYGATETVNNGGTATITQFTTKRFFLKLRLNPASRDMPLLQTFYPINGGASGADLRLG